MLMDPHSTDQHNPSRLYAGTSPVKEAPSQTEARTGPEQGNHKRQTMWHLLEQQSHLSQEAGLLLSALAHHHLDRHILDLVPQALVHLRRRTTP